MRKRLIKPSRIPLVAKAAASRPRRSALWPKAELCQFKADKWSQPNAVVRTLRQSVSISAGHQRSRTRVKPFAADDAAVGGQSDAKGGACPPSAALGAGGGHGAREARPTRLHRGAPLPTLRSLVNPARHQS